MIKTAMLMAAMTALFGVVGTLLAGFEGLLKIFNKRQLHKRLYF